MSKPVLYLNLTIKAPEGLSTVSIDTRRRDVLGSVISELISLYRRAEPITKLSVEEAIATDTVEMLMLKESCGVRLEKTLHSREEAIDLFGHDLPHVDESEGEPILVDSYGNKVVTTPEQACKMSDNDGIVGSPLEPADGYNMSDNG